MIEPELNPGPPTLAGKPTRGSTPPIFPTFSDDPLTQACNSSESAAYEQYLQLPELSKLWKSKAWPNWNDESLLKPALQALEITFRFISLVLSDSRPYVNKPEWIRRFESLTNQELELIALICEGEGEQQDLTAPIADCNVFNGVLLKHAGSQEVWKIPACNRLQTKNIRLQLSRINHSQKQSSYLLFSSVDNFRE